MTQGVVLTWQKSAGLAIPGCQRSISNLPKAPTEAGPSLHPSPIIVTFTCKILSRRLAGKHCAICCKEVALLEKLAVLKECVILTDV